MSILFWDDVPKKLGLEEWKEEQQHPEHPSYEPNMDIEDAKRWRARLFANAHPPRVEIRRTCQFLCGDITQMKIVIVNEPVPITEDSKYRIHGYDGDVIPGHISISMNGTAVLNVEEAYDLFLAVDEAVNRLIETKIYGK